MLFSILATLQQRWWLAAGLFGLATALKPLGIVLFLLTPLVYAPMRWRLPLVFLALLAAPFLFGAPAYVISQYREAWHNLQACAVVSEHRFADINGILRTLNLAFGPDASKLVRVGAGGLTALLWWWGGRRLREPMAGLWLYALATAYLMLFNPMTEENSYVILAPALAAWAVVFILGPFPQAPRPALFGWVITFMALSMGLLPNMVRPAFGNHFALFYHPLMAILFIALLADVARRSGGHVDASPVQPAGVLDGLNPGHQGIFQPREISQVPPSQDRPRSTRLCFWLPVLWMECSGLTR